MPGQGIATSNLLNPGQSSLMGPQMNDTLDTGMMYLDSLEVVIGDPPGNLGDDGAVRGSDNNETIPGHEDAVGTGLGQDVGDEIETIPGGKNALGTGLGQDPGDDIRFLEDTETINGGVNPDDKVRSVDNSDTLFGGDHPDIRDAEEPRPKTHAEKVREGEDPSQEPEGRGF